MNILIISLFYSPEPVARPHDLALILTKEGFIVDVITACPNYPSGKFYSNYNPGLAKWEEIENVKVLRVPHFVDRSRSAIRRILSYSAFSISAIINGLRRIKKPDAIWTYQIGLPGVILSKIWNVPLIHEIQDLWPDWGRSSNLGIINIAYKTLATEEKFIYYFANSLVTITEGLKSELTKKGVDPNKINVIPNWANDAFFQPDEVESKLILTDGFDDHFNIVYVGNIGTAQALGVVLDAATLLQDSPDIQFVIIGDGVERAELEQRSHNLGLNNVLFLGSRPQSDAAHYMALADVLFIHLKRDPKYGITIPSKTYGYLAAGRPILAATEGESAQLIEENHVGIACPPEDPMKLAYCVKMLHDMPKEQLAEMGKAGLQVANTLFSRVSLGKLYSDLFEKEIKNFEEGK